MLLIPVLITVFSSGSVFAQTTEIHTEDDASTDVFMLEEILVEGLLIEDTIRNTPKNVSVISGFEIEQSGANTVSEVLSTQAGVNIRSFSGQEKQATVDLRGMGATSVSNVLIFINDIKLNAPDLSGADLSSIHLDSVEKIEIIRGAETITYGDGAVAGVIKIYTKEPTIRPELNLQTRIGSYQTFNSSLGYSVKDNQLNLSSYIVHHKSEGYRENSYFSKGSGGLTLSHELGDRFTVELLASYHTDQYGLPGPVAIEDKDSEEQRIKSRNPDDNGETRDLRLTGGVRYQTDRDDEVEFKRSYRERRNEYLMGYNPSSTLTRSQQTSTIDENSESLSVAYTMPYSAFARDHRLKLGIDHFHSYYTRESTAQNERHNSNTDSVAFFLANRWTATDALLVNLGYRNSRFRGLFRKDIGRFSDAQYVWNNGDEIEKEWFNQGFSLGFSFRANETTTLFSSLATSFRTPNVDEFAEADSDLGPQFGQNMELGLRYDQEDGFNLVISLFQLVIEDEIYYGIEPDTGRTINSNYKNDTVRRGMEMEIKLFPTDSLYIWGNVSLLKAGFRDTDLSIPLVPERKGSIGAELTLTEKWTTSLEGLYVGEQFDGNDQSNDQFEKLDAYTVFNGRINFEFLGGKRLQFGVNNMFNQLYSSLAYSETYYPMPTRNYFCELNWSF